MKMAIKKDLDLIKNNFITHFKNFQEQFNDTREFSFPESNEKGKIPLTFFKEDAMIQAKWTENIIEIRFNEELITKEIIEKPILHSFVIYASQIFYFIYYNALNNFAYNEIYF